MACALCEERYDGWGLTLNVILTQTSQHRDPAWLTLKSHLGVTSLIDIQRRDKTGHFSSNGFCPFFVLFLMDKVFKVMSRTGLWRYTLWIGYVGPFSCGNFREDRPGTLEYSYQRWDTNEWCSGIPRRGNDLSEYLCLLNILMSQAKPLIFSIVQNVIYYLDILQGLQKSTLFLIHGCANKWAGSRVIFSVGGNVCNVITEPVCVSGHHWGWGASIPQSITQQLCTHSDTDNLHTLIHPRIQRCS